MAKDESGRAPEVATEAARPQAIAKHAVSPTYESIHREIIVPRCLSCHEGERAFHHVRLSTYGELLDGELSSALVTPGEPEKSDLYLTIASGKMPKGDRALAAEEVQAVYDWIKRGAPESEESAKTEPLHGPEHHHETPAPAVTPAPSATPTPGTTPGPVPSATPNPFDASEPCDATSETSEPGLKACAKP